MEDSNESLLKTIRHYQESLDKYTNYKSNSKLLYYIGKLSKLPIKVSHLEETGIGRTVNGLRKLGGEVGEAAKSLVGKWKKMVVVEDDTVEETHEEKAHSDNNSSDVNDAVEDVIKNSKNNKVSESSSSQQAHSSKKHKSVKDIGTYESPRSSDKYNSKHRTEKRKRSGSSSEDGDDDADDDDDDDDIIHDDNDDEVEQKSSESSDSEEEKREKAHRQKKKSKHHRSSDSSDEDHRRHKHKKAKYNRDDSDYESAEETSKSKAKKSKHSKEETHSKSHKSTKNKSSSHHEESSDKHKDSSKSHHDKSKHKSGASETKSTSSKSHSHSDKHQKEEKRDSSKSKGKEPNKDDKHLKDKSKEKRNLENKKSSSKHKSSGDKTKSGSTSGSSKPVSKEKIINGIDSGSGASFAEALGMCGPSASKASTSKKKTVATAPPEKNSNPPRNVTSDEGEKSNDEDSYVPKLLKESNLEPLDPNITSLLPTITPNYRPLGNFSLEEINRKGLTDEEALSKVISTKNQRTKVYSGNKTGWGKVPTLFELCTRVLQDNLDALEYTGGVPYLILKPILEKATANQLYMMEHHNPYLIEETDDLWKLHCQKTFRTKQRDELESWRDMYMRCLDEREAKLKALTANIKQSQDKSTPVRTTKLAYVDSVVKPPRNVLRKQMKNGTAFDTKKPTVTPSARLSTLATSGEAGKVAVPNPGSRATERSSGSSSALKPKKAPLMAKTLSLFKNRFRR